MTGHELLVLVYNLTRDLYRTLMTQRAHGARL